MEISSNVDDLLIQSMTGIAPPSAPEKPLEVPRETMAEQQDSAGLPKVEYPAAKVEEPKPKVEAEKPKIDINEYGDKEETQLETKEIEIENENEYGLETEAPKSYSKAEMDAYANQIVRERLARLERNHQPQQPAQQQQQQAQQQGFQYNEDSNLDWQQQLEQFVYQVADKREQNKAAQIQRAIEEQRIAAFEDKFKGGMEKFKDYHTVVGGKNVTDAMLMAASEIADPAALFYAASKRMPEELEKIAAIQNPYAQAAAIGKLDEKLRVQPKKTSNAPKPVSQTKTDTIAPMYQPKESTGNPLDDMLIADNAKRQAASNARRR